MPESDATEEVRKLVSDALSTYKKALSGADVTIAQYNAAKDVLRANGLLGDGAAKAPAKTSDIVEFELIDDADPLKNETESDAGAAESNSE